MNLFQKNKILNVSKRENKSMLAYLQRKLPIRFFINVLRHELHN
jgi:hypothetical protein